MLWVVGYDLHIIRGDDWTEATAIPVDEWYALIEQQPDFDIAGAVEATTSTSETLRYESPDLAEWARHPAGTGVPFDYRDGHVVVKNPDAPTIARMIELASMLGARVQGDDGEWYDEPPSPQRHRRRWPRRR